MAARKLFLLFAPIVSLLLVLSNPAHGGELERIKRAEALQTANGIDRGERQSLLARGGLPGFAGADVSMPATTSTSTTTTTISPFCDPVPPTGDPGALLFPLDGTFQPVDFLADGPTGSDPALGPDQHNDDDSATVELPFEFELFGELHRSVFVNNNGNLTFKLVNPAYVPDSLPSSLHVVAPFWADVDTGNPDCDRGRVWQRVDGNSLVVTWDNVGHFEHRGDRLNTFQVAISDGTVASMGIGNNVCFSFDEMQWTTGDTDGTGGFGAEPSIVGADRGNGFDFIQVGSFNHPGRDSDGAYGAHDGVDWLDGRTICFSTVGGGTEPSTTTTSTTTTTTVAVCGNGIAEEDEACDDGNVRDGDCCTSTCDLAAPGSACVPDRIPFGDQACFDMACNASGTCEVTRNQDPCDDGRYCTTDDVCTNGICRGAARSCDDGVGCTSEICDDIRDRCLRIVVHARCDDGSYCNGRETCDMLEDCQSGTPILCGDAVDCTVDRCDEDARGCVYEPNNGACADGSVCNGAEICDPDTGCRAGEPLVCSDPHTCTTDVCDEGAGGCAYSTDDSSCDDGNVCNGVETCNEARGCAPGVALACDDGNPCNGIETCDPEGGCRPGTPLDCDDGNACNGAETCDADRGCVDGTPLACNDGDVCNGEESCDAERGCVDGTPLACNDGDVCNGEETCDAETGCIDGTPLTCNDGDMCNGEETCDAETGCVDGTPLVCNDDDVCNGEETCDAETGCVDGTPLVCNDDDVCNGEEACDAEIGCIDGTPLTCTDDDVCNGEETCDAQVGCAPGERPSCAELDSFCSMGVCDADAGGCIAVPTNEGLPCGEADACGVSICSEGLCETRSETVDGSCEWTVIAFGENMEDPPGAAHYHGRRPRHDKDGAPSVRAHSFSRIEGDVCAARGAFGIGTTLNGSVASRYAGPRAGLVFGPWSNVERDICTSETSIRGFGDRTAVPGTWDNEIPPNVVREKHPLGTIDTTGRHDGLFACRDAVRRVDDWSQKAKELDSDGAVSTLYIAKRDSLALEIEPVDVADGIAVFDVAGLRLDRGASLVLTTSGTAAADAARMVVRIAGDLVLGLGASIRVAGNLSPENVLWVVEGRRCHVSLAGSGAGTLLCPNAAVEIGPAARWTGALYGTGVKVGLGARVVGRPFAGL